MAAARKARRSLSRPARICGVISCAIASASAACRISWSVTSSNSTASGSAWYCSGKSETVAAT